MPEKYRPEWCAQCIKDKPHGACRILTRSLIFSINEPEYPEEWIRDESGAPVCTAYDDGEALKPEPRCENTLEMDL